MLAVTAGYWRGDLQVAITDVSRPTQVIALNINGGFSLIRFADADQGTGILEQGGATGGAALDWTGSPGHPNEADCASDPFGLITNGSVAEWQIVGQDSDSVVRSTFRGSFQPDRTRAEGSFYATLTIPTCDEVPLPESSQASGTWKLRGDWVGDLFPTQFGWNDAGGIDVTFDVQGHRLPKPTRVVAYWAKGPTEHDALQQIVGWDTGVSEGTFEKSIDISDLDAPPAQATHVIFVVDPTYDNPIADVDRRDGLIRESTEDNNALSLVLPNIVGGVATVDAGVLSFSYSVHGPALPTVPKIEFWWSTSDSFADRVEQIDVVSKNGNKLRTSGGSDALLLEDLPAPPPPHATHLLIVLDPADPQDSDDYGTAIEAKHLDYEDNVIAVEFQEPITGLLVTSMNPTSSGFSAEFSTELDTASLNLHGTSDVLLTGNETGPIPGSLVINPDQRELTFIKSGGPLVADTYVVTMRSSADGFKDVDGNLLDGNHDGTAGDDFTGTFTIDSPANRTAIVGLPDFVRGPGQQVRVPADEVGLPLRISDGAGVRSVEIHLGYDPKLLTISAASVGADVPAGASVSLDTSTVGTVSLRFTSPSDLSPGASVFLTLAAHVPIANVGVNERRQQILDLHSVTITDADSNPILTVADDAVHLVGYFGDVSGNGRINSNDAAQLAGVAADLVSGFVATPLTDPGIVGDISSNGRVNSLDAALLAQFAAKRECRRYRPSPMTRMSPDLASRLEPCPKTPPHGLHSSSGPRFGLQLEWIPKHRGRQ